MNSYEEKQEAKRTYYQRQAEKARQEASARYSKAHDMAQAIPFGQPILVGHHSEKADRAYRERIATHWDKAAELYEKADYYDKKANSVGKGGISANDPDAVNKLKRKLEELKGCQETMKATNRALRIKDQTQGNEKLKEIGYTLEQIKEIRKPNHMGHIGFPSYALTNNNANIHRIEKRIKELEERNQEEVVEKTEMYEYRVEDNRVQFIFEGKPDEAVRGILKNHAFKWSPSRGAWVRQATRNGLYAAELVKKRLKEIADEN